MGKKQCQIVEKNSWKIYMKSM